MNIHIDRLKQVYADGIGLFTQHWIYYIVLNIVNFLKICGIAGALFLGFWLVNSIIPFGLIIWVLGAFLYALPLLCMILSGGWYITALKASRGEQIQSKDFMHISWGFVFCFLALTLIEICGYCFFLFPGIIFSSRFGFAPYIVFEDKVSALDALRRSWQLTSGFTGFLIVYYAVNFFLRIMLFFLPYSFYFFPHVALYGFIKKQRSVVISS